MRVYRTYRPQIVTPSAAGRSSVRARYNLKTTDTTVPSCFWSLGVPIERPTNGKVHPLASEAIPTERRTKRHRRLYPTPIKGSVTSKR